MKKLIYLFIIPTLLLLACNGSKRGDENDNAAPKDSSLRIAYLPVLDALPYYVAQERGLFEQNGLKVRLVPFMAQMDIDTALVGGSVDGAFTDIVRMEQMRGHADSADSDIIYLTSTESVWTLVSNRTARLNRLEQFGDKMVAMTRFSATDWLTDKAFSGVKTSADVYKVQINDVELRLKMLLNNEMDAVWMQEPFSSMAQKAGHKAILSSDKYKNKLGVVALRKASVDKQTEERLAKTYSMACDIINQEGFVGCQDELIKYCNADSSIVNRLKKTVFEPVQHPDSALLKDIRKYLGYEK